MDINLNVGVATPLVLPGASNASAPAKPTVPSAPLPGQHASSVPAHDAIEAKRIDAVVQASKNLFKDVYAVSDTTFSIYKDKSGQYITRYTSLRDGRVTYIPEPQLLMFQQSQSRASETLVQLKV